MKRLFLVMMAMAVLMTAGGQTQPAAQTVYLVEFSIYRVDEPVTGTHRLTPEDSSDKPLEPFTLFDEADLHFGDQSFRMDERGVAWGRAGSAGGGPLIASPKLLVNPGQQAELSVGSPPVQYMIRRSDGLFELKTSEISPGVRVELLDIVETGSGAITVSFRLSVTAVGNRVPIEGVELNVGEPETLMSQIAMTQKFAMGRSHGLLFQDPEGQGRLLVILRVTPQAQP